VAFLFHGYLAYDLTNTILKHCKLIKQIAGSPEERLKSNILLCGVKLAHDKTLLKTLTSKADVTLLLDTGKLEKTVKDRNITLVIVELSGSWQKDLSVIRSLKVKFPDIIIVIVNGGGSQETVIQSFRSGGVDFFKKPYNKKLLAERVEALIKINIVDQNNE